MLQIADKVRGVAAEKRLTQAQIAKIIGKDRKSVSARFSGQIPFSASEVWTLSVSLDEDIRKFFPDRLANAA